MKRWFLFLYILTTIPVLAQRNDFKMRFGAEVQKKLLTNLSGSLNLEQRFMDNISHADKLFLEPGLTYTINDAWSAGVLWRIIIKEYREPVKLSSHRYSVFARYAFVYDDFEFKIKSILQYGFDDITNPSFDIGQKLVNRNSLDISYNWFGQRITPGLKYELFYYMNHPRGGILNQWRLKAGAKYRLSKADALELFYMREKEFNVVSPVNANIIGLSFGHKF